MENSAIEPAVQQEEPRRVEIKTTLAAKVNLADFQNAVPVIRELSLVNETESDYKSLRLAVSSEPPFLKSKTWHIDQLASGQTIRLADIDLGLDGPLLGRLTESEKAVVTLQLTQGEEESAELALAESIVDLLPRNQWSGLSSLPDMVAAFVQPNEPVRTVSRMFCSGRRSCMRRCANDTPAHVAQDCSRDPKVDEWSQRPSWEGCRIRHRYSNIFRCFYGLAKGDRI